MITVVPDETGLLVLAKDEIAFAKAIDRILRDREYAKQLSVIYRISD